MTSKTNSNWLGFLISRRATPAVILSAYDIACALRDSDVPVAGGFDAPIERDCLNFLLRGTQPVLVVPARPLERFKAPRVWKDAIVQGRLRLHSPFNHEVRGNPRRNARQRNEALIELSAAILVGYASPGGGVETLALNLLRTARKPIFTFDLKDNAALIAAGAKPVNHKNVAVTIKGVLSSRRE